MRRRENERYRFIQRGALGVTPSFPSLILITEDLLEDTTTSLLDQQFTLSRKCPKGKWTTPDTPNENV